MKKYILFIVAVFAFLSIACNLGEKEDIKLCDTIALDKKMKDTNCDWHWRASIIGQIGPSFNPANPANPASPLNPMNQPDPTCRKVYKVLVYVPHAHKSVWVKVDSGSFDNIEIGKRYTFDDCQ